MKADGPFHCWMRPISSHDPWKIAESPLRRSLELRRFKGPTRGIDLARCRVLPQRPSFQGQYGQLSGQGAWKPTKYTTDTVRDHSGPLQRSEDLLWNKDSRNFPLGNPSLLILETQTPLIPLQVTMVLTPQTGHPR